MKTPLQIRLAQLCEKQDIVDFMKIHWGEDHPLLCCDKFFNHYYVDGINLQFALALQENKIVALAGYIRANHRPQPDIWISIWCASKEHNGAGLELLDALPTLAHARIVACNNIRLQTLPLYRFLGYTAERLPHYYRLAKKAEYTVAKVIDRTILPCGEGPLPVAVTTVAELSAFYAPNETIAPVKDIWYLERRYFEYPYQAYQVWRVGTCLLITRIVSVKDTYVLRIVDFIGRPQQFSAMGRAVDVLLQQYNAEYADCYCAGVSATLMHQAGFSVRDENSDNTIPNYLNPPLYENTEYYYCVNQPMDFMLFKADGDQDRPNLLPEDFHR